MFGFTRARIQQLNPSDLNKLHAYHCGLCHVLRQEYGLSAGMLAGRDGRLLVALHGAQDSVEPMVERTRCPAKFGLSSRTYFNNRVGLTYAAAISVLLFRGHLEDNVEDTKSVIASTLQHVTREKVDRAERVLTSIGFSCQALYDLREKQRELEQRRDLSRNLDALTRPSGRAVSLILAHTAILAGAPYNRRTLLAAGYSLGKLITVLDACEDYGTDKKTGKFNTIARAFALHDEALLSTHAYLETECFILLQLHRIRKYFSRIRLHRHHRLVASILQTGIYDSACNALGKLRKALLHARSVAFEPLECPVCGASVEFPFCARCGRARPRTTMIINQRPPNRNAASG